jgi:hypothetical protein
MKKKNGLLQTFFYVNKTLFIYFIYALTNHAGFTFSQGSRCRSPMLQFAIFFLDWRLKLSAGDFFAT